MSEQTHTLTEAKISTDIEQHSSPSFPKSILSVSREEFDGRDAEHQPLKLTVKKGITKEEVKLPPDLQGHVFIIGPVGSVASVSVSRKNNEDVDDCQNEDDHDAKLTVLPSKDGWTPLFNGDGMIYRLDFENDEAHLMTRIIKTPCYYADEATHNREEYKNLKFEDVGITRLSLKSLGVRNQVNTAFLSLKFPQEQSDRLLVTWDVGRPYEIDPKTLEIVAPVGWNEEWRELTPFVKPRPFKQVMTSAHPCFDPHTGEMFTVNVGKSLSTILGLSRSISSRLQKNASYLKSINFSKSPFTKDFREKVINSFTFFLKILQAIEKFSQRFAKKDFVYLMCWDGKSVNLSKKWRVLLPNGRNLKIEQSLHQMGLTRDYVVLADTGFKLLLEHFLPYQNSQIAEDAKILIADLLDYPQLPFTKVYIIRRDHLISSTKSQNVLQFIQRIVSKLPVVVAKEVQLPFEMAHYLVDYDNPDGKITLHVAHNCAADPAEFIRLFDRSVYDDRSEYDDPKVTFDLQQLAGITVGPMDVSRLGCYVIDEEGGKIVSKEVIANKNYTWSTAFCAYRDDIPTGQFKDIYWNSWGCWQDILTKRILDAYENYEGGRQVSVKEVLEITKKGIPSSLCHLHIDNHEIDNHQQVKLEIKKNAYQFPKGYLGTSAQFVPRANKVAQTDDQTDGYIICVVLHSDNLFSHKSNKLDNSKDWSDNSEIWIFDAKNLEGGPLYRLSHHKLNFGFTLHTTWLKEIASRPDSEYDVCKDHDELINKQPPGIRKEIRNLFEKEVYPKFKRNPFS